MRFTGGWNAQGRRFRLALALMWISLLAPGLAAPSFPPDLLRISLLAPGLAAPSLFHPALLSTPLLPSRILQFERYDLILALAWSADGQALAVSAGETLHLYAASKLGETPPAELAALEAGVWSPALAFSPDGRFLAAGGRDGMLRVWDAAAALAGPAPPTAPPPTHTLHAHYKGVNDLAFTPGGEAVASAGNDAIARLWDLASLPASSGDPDRLDTPRLEMIGGTYAVPSIAFSRDGKSLAISNGNVIRLREIVSGRFVQTLYMETGSAGEGESFYSLEISPDGNLLASGDTANTVRVWDLSSGALRNTLAGHTGEPGRYPALVWQVAFSQDGQLLASAGGDATVRVWELSSGTLLATLAGHSLAATSLAFSPDGRWLATGGLDARVILWEIGDLQGGE